ncbi:thioredoxin [Nocardioides pocheonensis]|uniref:Thioredoxin n=1 Tax=Nocardioides pocheonensis TaxID=661485 RepID=A0A3N0GJQ9_9ACTN|nr:thioredoxin [Nocardioides pocheonensis]RNM12446.1 thioredoxin [Nocardioides pocheonensis]
MISDITDDQFETEVLASDLPVLVEFWAPWCGPCHQVAPVVEQLAEERAGRLRVVKINQDENPLVSARYRVLGLPTLLVFDRGEPVAQITGARPKSAIARELDKVLPATA